MEMNDFLDYKSGILNENKIKRIKRILYSLYLRQHSDDFTVNDVEIFHLLSIDNDIQSMINDLEKKEEE